VTYRLPRTLEEVPERPFLLKLIVDAALLAPFEDFRLDGVLMMIRTAATRSELSPRIWPSSSGEGTGLPITCALMGSL
jgi:hypothetical protein